jgi:hypothetical protein
MDIINAKAAVRRRRTQSVSEEKQPLEDAAGSASVQSVHTAVTVQESQLIAFKTPE